VQVIIGAKLLSSKEAQRREKPFELRDSRLTGFLLRVQPSGVRGYYATWGHGNRIALGKVGVLTPEEARERCQKVLGNVAHGRPPLYGIDGADMEAAGPTLDEFITGTYEPWLRANRPRRAESSLQQLRANFTDWFPRPLTSITVEDVENWRIGRFSGDAQRGIKPIKPISVTRYLSRLAGVLTRAVKLKKLRENVVHQVEKPRVDRNPKVRFLDRDEEARLRAALVAGDGYARRTHLLPAVLVSINTGIRRCELLA
jgi:hypothetical protein